MKALCLHPMFLLGLAIRLTLMLVIMPAAVSDWYVPFMDVGTSRFTLDPWGLWLAGGGDPEAFPYGYAMWLAFLPLTLFAKLFALPLHLGYSLTLLAADIALLFVLRRMFPRLQAHLLLLVYWLSPIIILASYGLGRNDLIPVLFLVLSLDLVRRGGASIAAGGGGAFMAAISAKLSMVIALPFLVVYLYNNKPLRKYLPAFLKGLFLSAIILSVPFLLSRGGPQMLFENPEMGKIYSLALQVGDRVPVYIVPAIYLVMLYLIWRIRRMSFDLFLAATGVSFLVVLLLTSASPGWFVWLLPFLISYQATGVRAVVLVTIFAGIYVLNTLLVTPLQLFDGYVFDLGGVARAAVPAGGHMLFSLFHTGMVAVGAALVIHMWQAAVSRNDFFRFSRKPFAIGVAGDSGAGKDHFTDALTGLLGENAVTRLRGDDYHLWDRRLPMWKFVTHLNPMANNLERFGQDLVALIDRRDIRSRHYDHRTGKITGPFNTRSNDFIIVNGLHSLYLPIFRECYDLKVYLDMDEGLRRYFKLKRDAHHRGHSASQVAANLAKREPDSRRFIQPQTAHADLIFSVRPVCPGVLQGLAEQQGAPRLKLAVRARQNFNETSLARALVGICGLHVDVSVDSDGGEILMTIEGEVFALDMALIAERLCPFVLELLDTRPLWQNGVTGLMQLISLCHIDKALTKRLL